MASKFSLANSVTVSCLAPMIDGEVGVGAPLVKDVPCLLFRHETGSSGASDQHLSAYVTYEEIVPDTAVVAPFDFEMLYVVEQKQQDNTWEEIGRQNTPIRKLEQGPKRQVVIGPENSGVEEGVDYIIAGFGGVPAKLKSVFNDESSGILRVSVFVVDHAPDGPHPFVSAKISANGTRY